MDKAQSFYAVASHGGRVGGRGGEWWLGSAFLSWSFLFLVLDPMLPEQQLSARSSLVVMSQAGFRSALGGAVAMSSASLRWPSFFPELVNEPDDTRFNPSGIHQTVHPRENLARLLSHLGDASYFTGLGRS